MKDQLFECIVTLHRREDLEEFYHDMETPGGNLYIPDRSVDVDKRRPTSRNTHYMLTAEEMRTVKNDDRVWDVDRLDLRPRPQPDWYAEDQRYTKNTVKDSFDKNWGNYRHVIDSPIPQWGWNGTAPTQIVDNRITASGKNVDVLIVDGHMRPTHPEFAVNPNGTGGSRVVQYNWFQNDVGFGTGTYNYNTYTSYGANHGCHTGGTTAGNSQGWARDATIYNINPYETENPNDGVLGYSDSVMWDYIRAWHNSKPINPATGRRNPTVSNHSYGTKVQVTGNRTGYFWPTRVLYRGNIVTEPGPEGTIIGADTYKGMNIKSQGAQVECQYYFSSHFADVQDAIADGIICVASAGNLGQKIVNSADQDFNTIIYWPNIYGPDLEIYPLRGSGSLQGMDELINVGAMNDDVSEGRATFSNNGQHVCVWSAGEAIQSSYNYASGNTVSDPRDTNYLLNKSQGTSMAGPQVCGVLACLAESWPSMTQAQAKEWIETNGLKDQVYDSGTGDITDEDALMGGPNNMLYWFNQRPEEGAASPKVNFLPRPVEGATWPRTRTRKWG